MELGREWAISEGVFTRCCVEEDRAQAEHVTCRVHWPAESLFGRHISGVTDDHARFTQLAATGDARYAEVEDPRAVIQQQYV